MNKFPPRLTALPDFSLLFLYSLRWTLEVFKKLRDVPIVVQQVKSLTSTNEDAGSIPGLA